MSDARLSEALRTSRREFVRVLGAASAAAASWPLGLQWVGAEASRSFRIGACDWSIGKTGQVAALEVAREIGLDGVQVSFGAPGQGDDLRDEAARARYIEASKRTGVAVASMAMGILNSVPLASRPEAETYVLDCIDAMVKMGQSLVLLAFFGDGDIREASKQETLIPVLKRLAPKAEKAHVLLGIESWLNAEDTLKLIDRVGSPAVKVYYDVCNMTDRGYALDREILLLGKKGMLCEIHAKENGILLGGRVDFKQVRAALDEVGYAGWLIIEGAVPSGASLMESYKENLRFLRAIFPKG